MFERILLAIDLKEKSKRGINYSIDLSKKHDSFINIIHINQDFIGDSEQIMSRVNTNQIDADIQNYNKNCTKQINEYIKSYSTDFKNYKIFFKHGDAAEQIMKIGQELDISLIIMGTNGKDSLKDYLLGSTATTVIEHSHIPILVLPNK